MEDKIIYMDYAATTPLDKEVLEAMMPYLTDVYANPSAIYQFAGKAKRAVEAAREEVAKLIDASRDEIYFTSGGSESDNWALKAVCDLYKDKGKHIITSKIEHHAILHTCEYLEKAGFEVTYLDVLEDGRVDPEILKKEIREDTILVSIMTANNEIGTIQSIKEFGQIAHEHGALFHTDAVQAMGHIPISVKEEEIDLLSASAHKLNGPKGIGILYIKKGIKLGSFIHGGAQERSRRAGTLNTPAIIGFGKACELARKNFKEEELVLERRNYMIDRILKEIPMCRLNGSIENRLPNNINVSFAYVQGESVLILLDQKGICASSGSACSSGSLDPSHVLLAIGATKEEAHSSIRLTIGKETTYEEIDFVVEQLKEIVDRLRNLNENYNA